MHLQLSTIRHLQHHLISQSSHTHTHMNSVVMKETLNHQYLQPPKLPANLQYPSPSPCRHHHSHHHLHHHHHRHPLPDLQMMIITCDPQRPGAIIASGDGLCNNELRCSVGMEEFEMNCGDDKRADESSDGEKQQNEKRNTNGHRLLIKPLRQFNDLWNVLHRFALFSHNNFREQYEDSHHQCRFRD